MMKKKDDLAEINGLQGVYVMKDVTTGAVYYVGESSNIGALTFYHTTTQNKTLYSAMIEVLGEAEATKKIMREISVEIYKAEDKEYREMLASVLIEKHQPEYNLNGLVRSMDVVELTIRY